MEHPFDYIAAPAIERRDAAVCARKVRECIAYIREHNLSGERLDTWRGFVRNWRAQQRHYRRIERRKRIQSYYDDVASSEGWA